MDRPERSPRIAIGAPLAFEVVAEGPCAAPEARREVRLPAGMRPPEVGEIPERHGADGEIAGTLGVAHQRAGEEIVSPQVAERTLEGSGILAAVEGRFERGIGEVGRTRLVALAPRDRAELEQHRGGRNRGRGLRRMAKREEQGAIRLLGEIDVARLGRHPAEIVENRRMRGQHA